MTSKFDGLKQEQADLQVQQSSSGKTQFCTRRLQLGQLDGGLEDPLALRGWGPLFPSRGSSMELVGFVTAWWLSSKHEQPGLWVV